MPTLLMWSGGKDSTASVILCHEHGLQIDEIIMSEVMFDKDFTGENPLHMEWVYNVAKPLFESWGYRVTVLRSERTYLDEFYHVIKKATKHPQHNGMKYGFPVYNRCSIRRDLKIRPIEQYKARKYRSGYDELMGICADEPKRLRTMHKNPSAFSVLENYGYTEAMCMELCREYNLLSPAYQFSDRQGCFFCANAQKAEMEFVKNRHPEIWEKFLSLEREETAFDKWNPFRGTLSEIDAVI